MPSSLKPIKNLKPPSLWLNLSGTTIWSTFTKSKSIGCLDLWNSFSLTLTLSNVCVFSVILLYCTDSVTDILFFGIL